MNKCKRFAFVSFAFESFKLFSRSNPGVWGVLGWARWMIWRSASLLHQMPPNMQIRQRECAGSTHALKRWLKQFAIRVVKLIAFACRENHETKSVCTSYYYCCYLINYNLMFDTIKKIMNYTSCSRNSVIVANKMIEIHSFLFEKKKIITTIRD